MDAAKIIKSAYRVVESLDIADGEAEPDYYYALFADETFRYVCHLYELVDSYLENEDATGTDAEARDALERSVQEHAERVREEMDE